MKAHFKKALMISGFFLSFFPFTAFPAELHTGTYLESTSTPTLIIHFNQEDEIKNIRRLLSAGNKAAALTSAIKYVAKLENTTTKENIKKYYAYNALCSVKTSLGQLLDAIEACGTAIALAPGKWSAINNRGTAYLVSGQFSEALKDYELALLKAPSGNDKIVKTIQHNIYLTEAWKNNH